MKFRTCFFSLVFIAVFFQSCITTDRTTVSVQDDNIVSSISEEQKKTEKYIPINNPVPEGYVQNIENFESGCYWYGNSKTIREDCSIDAEEYDEWASEGDYSCRFSFTPTPQNYKSTFSCNNISITDWTGVKILTADFNNPSNSPLTIYCVIFCGNEHAIIKTEKISIGPGENTNVYFDLIHNLKDENDNDVNSIMQENNVREIGFVVEGKNKGGCLLIDNINLVF